MLSTILDSISKIKPDMRIKSSCISGPHGHDYAHHVLPYHPKRCDIQTPAPELITRVFMAIDTLDNFFLPKAPYIDLCKQTDLPC